MGCHPADPESGAPSGLHNISFYCDDVHATVADLRSRGVEFTDEITDRGYGLVTHFRMPGSVEVQLYQPRYDK
jgi:4-hydroxyphenylpyruvate dioxygenase-like putative hemolysin